MPKKLILRTLSLLLYPIDKILGLAYLSASQDVKPIFIFGAPRSGTTLVSQILFSVVKEKSFLSNIDNYMPQRPFFNALFKSRHGKAGYESKYGRVKGLGSISEGGAVWNQWFPDEKFQGYNYTDETDLTSEINKKIKVYLSRICRSQKSSIFINKNTKNSVRIRALYSIFPNAFFIHVHRKVEENAISLLEARASLLGDPKKWLWVKPRKAEELIDLSPEEQVVGQVLYLEQDILDQLSHLAPGSHLSISYDELLEKGLPYFENQVIAKLLTWDASLEIDQLEKIGLHTKKSTSIPNSIRDAVKKFRGN